ncbi:thermostable hemolysin [Streptomyces sp. NPDC048717]|uniref:thermostable hemolysin n=1 Tax=unclassified Streptomyces TaxID=2593676 RepID=UPI0034178FA0
MLKISLAQRDTDDWHQAVELARTTYADVYAADIKPDPDAFVVASRADADRPEDEDARALVGCAGLTYGLDRPFFSERYLDTGVEEAIAAHTGGPVDRGRVIEIGALAGPGGAGREMVRLIPIIAWTMGMEYILCTATEQLGTLFDRLGVNFTALGEADPGRLGPGEPATWGTYYDQRPVAGFIDLSRLSGLFAGSTGRYAFFAPVVELLTETTGAREVASRAGR